MSLFQQIADAFARDKLDDFRREPVIRRTKVEGDQLLDKPVTMRDLLQGGVMSIDVGGRVIGKGGIQVNSNGGGATLGAGFDLDIPISNGGLPTLLVPPTPANLTAAGTFRAVILTWTLAEYFNHAFTEVWRNTTNNLGTAVLIGSAKPNIYVDQTAVMGVTYFYWVRAVGSPPATSPSPYNAVSGTSGGPGLVGNADLGPLIIEAANLASNAVTSVKIADNSIIAGKIAANAIAVGSAAIQDGAIRNALIADAAIDSAKIADAAISSAKIGDATITSAKIVDGAILNAKIANAAIDSAKIQDAAITDAKIANLSANKITTGSMDAARITAGTITTDRIQVGAVTASQVGSYESGSVPFAGTNSVSITSTAASMVTTGAPVKIAGAVTVDFTTSNAYAYCDIFVEFLDGGGFVSGALLTRERAVPDIGKTVVTTLPVVGRYTPAPGTHSLSVRVTVNFWAGVGVAATVSGGMLVQANFWAEENKV